jgi:hypothetical protein
MVKKFFNSVDWGIQKENINTIRSNGLDMLDNMGCNACKHFSLSISQAIKDKNLINEIFSNGNMYLVLCEPNTSQKSRTGSLGVKNADGLYQIISRIDPITWQEYNISIIQQIIEIEHSLAGTAISDGNGKLLIEFITGTTDSRMLTSCGADPTRLDLCFFGDYDTISVMPHNIPIRIIEKIKDSCQYNKGYYEFIYGKAETEEDVFYTFYSDIKAYRNILEFYEADIDTEIKSRIKFQYLKSKEKSIPIQNRTIEKNHKDKRKDEIDNER